MCTLNISICRFVRNISIITAFLIACLVSRAEAENKVLSIQSTTITPYEEAIKGFQGACNVHVDKFVISEMKDKDIVTEIRKAKPSLILSVGMDAFEKARGIDDIPVVYVMVPGLPPIPEKGISFTGVIMNISQEEKLSAFMKAVPSIKNIGLVYNQEKTGYLAQRAIDACRKAGINLIAKEIHNSREAPAAIKSMEGQIDGFWMLPDSTVFTSETIEYLFLFSIGNRVPILTFSERYLDSGALISVGVDPFDMGSQAGELAREIISGTPVSTILPVDARKAVISINNKIAEKLGINIDEKLFSGVKFLK
jgi:putative tryptophan/tyrosine transport system substrate-binding protein